MQSADLLEKLLNPFYFQPQSCFTLPLPYGLYHVTVYTVPNMSFDKKDKIIAYTDGSLIGTKHTSGPLSMGGSFLLLRDGDAIAYGLITIAPNAPYSSPFAFEEVPALAAEIYCPFITALFIDSRVAQEYDRTPICITASIPHVNVKGHGEDGWHNTVDALSRLAKLRKSEELAIQNGIFSAKTPKSPVLIDLDRQAECPSFEKQWAKAITAREHFTQRHTHPHFLRTAILIHKSYGFQNPEKHKISSKYRKMLRNAGYYTTLERRRSFIPKHNKSLHIANHLLSDLENIEEWSYGEMPGNNHLIYKVQPDHGPHIDFYLYTEHRRKHYGQSYGFMLCGGELIGILGVIGPSFGKKTLKTQQDTLRGLFWKSNIAITFHIVDGNNPENYHEKEILDTIASLNGAMKKEITDRLKERYSPQSQQQA